MNARYMEKYKIEYHTYSDSDWITQCNHWELEEICFFGWYGSEPLALDESVVAIFKIKYHGR